MSKQIIRSLIYFPRILKQKYFDLGNFYNPKNKINNMAETRKDNIFSKAILVLFPEIE